MNKIKNKSVNNIRRIKYKLYKKYKIFITQN